jgi:4-hydroxybenzoate polyprenyltransferase
MCQKKHKENRSSYYLRKKIKNYYELLRVKHYIKNLLIFIPLFFGKGIYDWNKLQTTALGCIAFCMGASFVYIINDVRDVEKDRLHPTKCNRPIASGEVSVRNAVTIAVIFLACAYLIVGMMDNSVSVGICLSVYILINIGYSLVLKNIPIIDVAILASGFLIRIIYGGIVSCVEVSSWLYLTVIVLAFYFGLGKRRNELKKIGNGETRSVIKNYTYEFLDRNMYMCLDCGIVFYSLWAMERSKNCIWTVPLVMIICMKYNLLLETNSDGDPITTLCSSWELLALVVIYVCVIFGILYLNIL